MKILVVNSGSSSVKVKLFEMEDESLICSGVLDRLGTADSIFTYEPAGCGTIKIHKSDLDHVQALKFIFEVFVDPDFGCIRSLNEIDAVGHRVVHGGESFSEATIIDHAVMKAIGDCSEIAPLHNPYNLDGIEICRRLLPDVRQVAVFDTAFHQTMPPEHYLYALPFETYEKYGIRRYGFHGTSHNYVSHRAAELLGRPFEQCSLISIHLGNGASMAAIKNGKVLDTSMGFTPLEGLVMGTRCGDLDPAVVYYLMGKMKLSIKETDDYFNKQTGMFGLSGISNDMRDIIAAATSGNQRARLSLEIYCARVKGYIGNYMAKLNGCDCLIFTAGVAENQFEIREKICSNLDGLGIKLDPHRNRAQRGEFEISAEDSPVKILVVPTQEELMIARETDRAIRRD